MLEVVFPVDCGQKALTATPCGAVLLAAQAREVTRVNQASIGADECLF